MAFEEVVLLELETDEYRIGAAHALWLVGCHLWESCLLPESIGLVDAHLLFSTDPSAWYTLRCSLDPFQGNSVALIGKP